jgi:TolB-like protein/DNA-binding winged helix-turn-helix (wHTH) protein/tetratricopeptide (TPR) repeat protein
VSVAAGQEILVRFAEFELDLRSGELRTNGTSVKLQPQPAKILALLVRRRGETVTRDEIIKEVWGSDTFVDYEQGLNFAIRQIRTALGDDAERPVYIETVPKRGYRFVAPVVETADVSVPTPETSPRISRNWRDRILKIAGVILIAALVLLAIPGLRHWLIGRMGKQPIRSLAVLPFENLSGDAAKDYFADGFTDELTTDLAEQTKLRVVSRTSVLRYKGSRKPLPEIAQELRVDAIVEGSVSISDQQVRITAQLIEASSDRHLWAHSYERDRKDLFSVQSEVAATITNLIGTNAGTRRSTTTVLGRKFTPETYQLYLECRTLTQTGSEDGMNHAIQCYQQVLNLDPNCASAYASLADAYTNLGQLDNLSKGRTAVMKALELDSSLPEAHATLARIKLGVDQDLGGAEAEINRALALNPSDARAYTTYAAVLMARGRMAEAIAAAKSARELDPFSAHIATGLGVILFMAGQYDRTIVEEEAALQLNPQDERGHYWLGYAYEQKGMYKNAIAEYEKGLPNDDHGIFLAALGRSFVLAGDSKKVAEVKRKIEHFPAGDFVWHYDAALFYVVLGDKDRAFQLLERDLKEGGGWSTVLNADPRLAPLRSDPRFRDLVRRAGLPAASPS